MGNDKGEEVHSQRQFADIELGAQALNAHSAYSHHSGVLGTTLAVWAR